MNNPLTLGSLFSGSGGFELGGLLCGVQPIWASEIEPFPIRVTTKRMPWLQHLGDINRINGAAVPPVDIITGGFCCQDLSVAGKRAGLHGERSGLFFQIIRIIKEMRAATNNAYPTFAVLENVPGMYSSRGGEDFLEVLNELAKIKDETLSIPMPADGKWSTAGEAVGDGFSLGWRTLDAQFWGVAQRRRRCYIVVDFAGERAGKILFDETRLRGHPPQGSFAGQTTAAGAVAGVGGAVAFEPGIMQRLGRPPSVEVSPTLRCDMGDNRTSVAIPVNTQVGLREHKNDGTGLGVGEDGDPAYTLQAAHSHAVAIENHPQDSRVKLREDGTVQTLTARMGLGGGNVPMVFGIGSYDSNAMKSANPHAGIYEACTTRTLDCNGGNPACNQGGMAVVAVEGNGARPSHKGNGYGGEVSFTLNSVENHGVAYCMTTGHYMQVREEQSPALLARDYKDPLVVNQPPRYIVRRLTPQECALLQGFPVEWCAGLETPDPSEEDIAFWAQVFETHCLAMGKSTKLKSRAQIVKWLQNPHSDAKEYSTWGNGVALPCVVFVLQGISEAST